jgi:hypothetical protein
MISILDKGGDCIIASAYKSLNVVLTSCIPKVDQIVQRARESNQNDVYTL